jgi:hypothetical protein
VAGRAPPAFPSGWMPRPGGVRRDHLGRGAGCAAAARKLRSRNALIDRAARSTALAGQSVPGNSTPFQASQVIAGWRVYARIFQDYCSGFARREPRARGPAALRDSAPLLPGLRPRRRCDPCGREPTAAAILVLSPTFSRGRYHEQT